MTASTQKAKQPWHPADISCALKKKGYTYRRVAKDLNIAPTTVSTMVNENRNVYRVAEHIAKVIGVSMDTIWPGKFNYTPQESHKQRDARMAKKRQALNAKDDLAQRHADNDTDPLHS